MCRDQSERLATRELETSVVDTIVDRLKSHPAVLPGFLEDAVPTGALRAFSGADRDSLSKVGINLDGDGGNALIIVPVDMRYGQVKLHFLEGSEGALVLLGRSSGQIKLDLKMKGPGHAFAFGDTRGLAATVSIQGKRDACTIGRETSINGMAVRMDGTSCSVSIGRDCMFSQGIIIRTTDSHAIVDLNTNEQINKPRSVVIAPHVWLGQDVVVLKGAKIGSGSIIGTRSVVTGQIPAKSVAAGTPAEVRRRNVSWVRSAMVSPGLLQSMRESLMEDVQI